MPRYIELGPLSHQQHTDWRCSTTAWRRGRWRPVVSVRIGRAAAPGFGFMVGRDDEGRWTLTIAVLGLLDVFASLVGPWEGDELP